MEKCSKCKKIKLDTEFYRNNGLRSHNRKSGLSYYCKECTEEERRQSPDRAKRTRERWNERHPNLSQIQQWIRKYKIDFTVPQYHKLLNQQNGCCAICGRHQSEFKHNLGIDHNHQTKQIRGLLCPPCNRVVSHLEEGAGHLRRCQAYLKFWNNRAIGIVSVA